MRVFWLHVQNDWSLRCIVKWEQTLLHLNEHASVCHLLWYSEWSFVNLSCCLFLFPIINAFLAIIIGQWIYCLISSLISLAFEISSSHICWKYLSFRNILKIFLCIQLKAWDIFYNPDDRQHIIKLRYRWCTYSVFFIFPSLKKLK